MNYLTSVVTHVIRHNEHDTCHILPKSNTTEKFLPLSFINLALCNTLFILITDKQIIKIIYKQLQT